MACRRYSPSARKPKPKPIRNSPLGLPPLKNFRYTKTSVPPLKNIRYGRSIYVYSYCSCFARRKRLAWQCLEFYIRSIIRRCFAICDSGINIGRPYLSPLFVRFATLFAESALNAVYSRAICYTINSSTRCTYRLKTDPNGSTAILCANATHSEGLRLFVMDIWPSVTRGTAPGRLFTAG